MSIFDAAVKGYTTAQALTKEARAYQGAVQEYGLARASDPDMFNKLDQNRRQEETHESLQEDRRISREENGVLNLVQGLMQARDSGQDVGEAFDKLSDMLPNIGVDPGDIPAMKEKLVQDPKILDAYYAALADPSKMKGLTAKQRQDAAAAEEKTRKGQIAVSTGVHDMMEAFGELDDLNAVRSTEAGGVERVWRSMKSGWVGTRVGEFTTSEASKHREIIKRTAPGLLNAMKVATEAGAKMFDSNRDMEMWLETVTDPQTSVQAARQMLQRFNEQFGLMMAGKEWSTINLREALDIAQGNDENYSATDGSNNGVIAPGYVDKVSGLTFIGTDPSDTSHWE